MKEKKIKNKKCPQFMEKVYKEYKTRLFNFLFFKANGNEYIAEEILSDTIYSALLSVQNIKNKDNIFPWLLSIAQKRFYDYLKKIYKDKNLNEKIQEDHKININNYQIKDIETTIILDQAMKNIKPKYRIILELKYIEKKSQKEIARLLNKSRSSIENLLYRARKKLKQEIKTVKNSYFFL